MSDCDCDYDFFLFGLSDVCCLLWIHITSSDSTAILIFWSHSLTILLPFSVDLTIDMLCFAVNAILTYLFARLMPSYLYSLVEIGIATEECFLRATPTTELLALSSVDEKVGDNTPSDNNSNSNNNDNDSNCWVIQDKEELYVTVFQTTARHSASVAVVNEGSSSRFLHRPAWASVKEKGGMLTPWQPLSTSTGDGDEDGEEESDEELPVFGTTSPVVAAPTGTTGTRAESINDVVNKSMSSFLSRLLVVSDYLRAAQRQTLLRRVLALFRQIIRFPPFVMAFRAVCVGSAISDHEVRTQSSARDDC